MFDQLFQCLQSNFSKELNNMRIKGGICFFSFVHLKLTFRHMLRYPIIIFFLQKHAIHLQLLPLLCQILKAIVGHLSKGLPTPGIEGQKYAKRLIIIIIKTLVDLLK